jgi:hypothetical protein
MVPIRHRSGTSFHAKVSLSRTALANSWVNWPNWQGDRHFGAVGAADDDRTGGAGFKQPDAAEDQGTHDPLAKLGLRQSKAHAAAPGGRCCEEAGQSPDHCARLQGFLRHNGHPHQLLNPETDDEAKALIERFHFDPGQLPIVLCPGGQMLRNPSEQQLARCVGLVRPIRSGSTTLP